MAEAIKAKAKEAAKKEVAKEVVAGTVEKPTKTEAKPKEKKAKKSRKIIVKASKETSVLRNLTQTRPSMPIFRGSFGQKGVRKIKTAKWNRWHVPRGIDKNHDQSEGFIPRGGYRSMKSIRHRHPSGYNEVMIKTLHELSGAKKGVAVRIISGIGKKKKMEIVDKAIGMGIKVLNP